MQIPRATGGVAISTIGVGSSVGGPIPLGRDLFGQVQYKEVKGKEIVTKLEPEILKKLVQNGGKYQSLDRQESLSFEEGYTGSPIPKTLLAFGSLCLLIGLILPYRRTYISAL